MAPLLLALGVAIASLLALFVLLDAQRTRAFKDLARARGWQYAAREPGLGRFGRFRACRSGQDHRLLRRAFGELQGARVDLAEIAHVERDRVQQGRQRATLQTACLIESPALRLPAFYARPRSPLDELGRLANLQDIPFPEDPAFSAALLVQGEDPEAIRARFDPRARAWLLLRAGERLSYEGVADALLVVAPQPLDEARLPRLLDEALELARLFEAAPPNPEVRKESP